jgi:3-oxoacyl-[acyl-carrier-protein] synthase-3
MMALKSAYHQVLAGDKDNAAVVACEFASRASKSSHFAGAGAIDADRAVALEMAFLRYMLSDGAGAAILQNRPAAQGVSLRIDWITLTSYANTENACMYFGSNSNSAEKSWLDYSCAQEALAAGALAPRQNLALLPHLVKVGLDEYQKLLDQGRFDPADLRWMPVHYSSERMKTLVMTEGARRGIAGPPADRWFSNLTKVGNIGSASIYVILEELLAENMINPGDKLLCMVPESGRFSVAFMHLTAVAGEPARM